MDRISPENRSENMRRIRSRDTAPEWIVRQFLHAKGLRFRLHRADLPGKPDLAFAAMRVCVFVHGCFWHGCPHCRHGRRTVRSNTAYWSKKIENNKARDRVVHTKLKALGWRPIVIWECEVGNAAGLERLVAKIASRGP